MHIRWVLVIALISLAPLQEARAQSAQCSIWGNADFYEYAHTLCGGSATTDFVINVTETIFHGPIQNTITSPPPSLCMSSYPLSVYPPDVYGRQWATMTITTSDDPGTILAQCDFEHIHTRAAAVEIVLAVQRGRERV